ncbi:MAG: hypothetical protein IPG71_06745 [bacterium]|nr:hypothetical protein [bacterium]
MAAFYVYALAATAILAGTMLSPSAPEWLWSISFMGNAGLLWLTSLLAFLAYRQEQHYRGVFFYVWLYFALNSLSLPAYVLLLATGIRDVEIAAYVWVSLIGVHTILAWSITSITVDYMSSAKRRVFNVLVAGLVLFAVSGGCIPPTSGIRWQFWFKSTKASLSQTTIASTHRLRFSTSTPC